MHSTKQFTKEEKDACLPMIDFLVNCAKIKHKKGVLILEELAEACPSYFARFLMMLVVDGIDPELIQALGETLLDAEDYTGHELLERVIILQGIIQIQAGLNSRILEAQLFCILGESHLKERFGESGYLHKVEVAPSFDEVLGENPLPKCTVFDNGIQSLTIEDIRRILLEIDMMHLCMVLRGCGKAAIEKIRSATSKALQTRLTQELERMGEVETDDILEMQTRMVRIIKRLADCGEITLTKGAFDQIIFRVVEKESE